MAYAAAGKAVETHPLYGTDPAQERILRTKEFDDFTPTLLKALPDFASAEDGVQQLRILLEDESEDDGSGEDDEDDNVEDSLQTDDPPKTDDVPKP